MEQAIARAARMVQARNVRMLAGKRQIFDDYARRSAIAEVGEAAVERQLVSDLADYAAEEARKRGLAVQ